MAASTTNSHRRSTPATAAASRPAAMPGGGHRPGHQPERHRALRPRWSRPRRAPGSAARRPRTPARGAPRPPRRRARRGRRREEQLGRGRADQAGHDRGAAADPVREVAAEQPGRDRREAEGREQPPRLYDARVELAHERHRKERQREGARAGSRPAPPRAPTPHRHAALCGASRTFPPSLVSDCSPVTQPTRASVTGQMTFDSHVLNLVDVAARLVNHLTAGESGGVEVATAHRCRATSRRRRRARWRGPSYPAGERRAGRGARRGRGTGCGTCSTASSAGDERRRRTHRSTRCCCGTGARPQLDRLPDGATVARALPRLRRLARHRLGSRLRDRARSRDRQRPGRPARRLRGRAVRPGLRRHLAQRDPAVLLDGVPEPHQGRRVPRPAMRRRRPALGWCVVNPPERSRGGRHGDLRREPGRRSPRCRG